MGGRSFLSQRLQALHYRTQHAVKGGKLLSPLTRWSFSSTIADISSAVSRPSCVSSSAPR